MESSSFDTAVKYIGGFGGYINTDISYCYALGDIDVNTDGYVGGFAGQIMSKTVTNCFAFGNVTVNGQKNVFAGGFAGSPRQITISDCYALGDVTVDTKDKGIIRAGGFGGRCLTMNIIRCFAAGSVEAHQYDTTGTNAIFAAGLVGDASFSSFGRIHHSAALGASVLATGSFSTSTPGYFDADGNAVIATGRQLGRIYGEGDPSFNDTLGPPSLNNYANSAMTVRQSNNYRATGSNVTLAAADKTHDKKHGADATAARTKERSFWDQGYWDFANEKYIAGLDFSDDNWLFTTVGSLGHPILRGPPVNGVPGAALGGDVQLNPPSK
jgi:hypothetical protein